MYVVGTCVFLPLKNPLSTTGPPSYWKLALPLTLARNLLQICSVPKWLVCLIGHRPKGRTRLESGCLETFLGSLFYGKSASLCGSLGLTHSLGARGWVWLQRCSKRLKLKCRGNTDWESAVLEEILVFGCSCLWGLGESASFLWLDHVSQGC